ncbi:OmpH family outer membrane protein [Cryomorphaceae bacterium 1068]|nr:OmpH family outer membrane protein [Cryomorphaceae bacterium 1068]
MKNILFTSALAAVLLMVSCNDSQVKDLPNESAQSAVDSAKIEVEVSGLKVAFIYGDTVNTKYRFLMDAQDELEKEQRVIEERINRKLQKAEQRAMELQKQAPTMTQMQVQEAQLELQNLDIEIQQFQERLATDFRKREVELQVEYTGRVNKMLEEYNSDGTYDMILNFQPGGNLLWIKDSYDITDEVLQKLNDQYDADLTQQSEENTTE